MSTDLLYLLWEWSTSFLFLLPVCHVTWRHFRLLAHGPGVYCPLLLLFLIDPNHGNSDANYCYIFEYIEYFIYIYIYIVANQYIQFRLLKNCLFQYGKITFYLVRHDFSHVECGVDPQNLFFDFLPPWISKSWLHEFLNPGSLFPKFLTTCHSRLGLPRFIDPDFLTSLFPRSVIPRSYSFTSMILNAWLLDFLCTMASSLLTPFWFI